MPFSVGANLPWITYGGDFGANAWRPQGGLAAQGVSLDAFASLTDIRGLGVETIRWFMFCDGRAGIRFDDDGSPLGLDQHVLQDLGAALQLASASDVRIVFTLFDFLFCAPRAHVAGVDTGGHAAVLGDPRKREALLGHVVTPVLEALANHPAIHAWDIINEPEWAAAGVGQSSMADFIRQASALVHSIASQPVTVGLASARGLDLVRGAGLDFYQVHWYEKHEPEAPLRRDVREMNLDRPVVLGEFPTRGSRFTTDEILRTSSQAGYSGAWFWSINGEDAASDVDAAIEGLRQWQT
jgi:mannan endo-1,4-beta-mannosidase